MNSTIHMDFRFKLRASKGPNNLPNAHCMLTNDCFALSNSYLWSSNDYLRSSNGYLRSSNDYLGLSNDYCMLSNDCFALSNSYLWSSNDCFRSSKEFCIGTLLPARCRRAIASNRGKQSVVNGYGCSDF